MAVTTRDLYLSKNSIAYSCLAKAPTGSAGVNNPISLPRVSFNIIKETFGNQITQGNHSTIYQVKVKEDTPPRVYKVVSLDEFKDGNEIRISRVASALRVAPTFYSAFIVEQNNSNGFVVIEMDDSGKSLGKLMADLGKNIKTNEKEKDSKPKYQLSEKDKALKEMQKRLIAQIHEMHGDEFGSEFIIKTKEMEIVEAVDQLYPNRETFYCALFEKIKILADNKIAYDDPNVGNIMPNLGTEKGLQLIDFDTAELMNDPIAAATKSLGSAYTFVHITEFRRLHNPSKKSQQLLKWIYQNRKS